MQLSPDIVKHPLRGETKLLLVENHCCRYSLCLSQQKPAFGISQHPFFIPPSLLSSPQYLSLSLSLSLSPSPYLSLPLSLSPFLPFFSSFHSILLTEFEVSGIPMLWLYLMPTCPMQTLPLLWFFSSFLHKSEHAGSLFFLQKPNFSSVSQILWPMLTALLTHILACHLLRVFVMWCEAHPAPVSLWSCPLARFCHLPSVGHDVQANSHHRQECIKVTGRNC